MTCGKSASGGSRHNLVLVRKTALKTSSRPWPPSTTTRVRMHSPNLLRSTHGKAATARNQFGNSLRRRSIEPQPKPPEFPASGKPAEQWQQAKADVAASRRQIDAGDGAVTNRVLADLLGVKKYVDAGSAAEIRPPTGCHCRPHRRPSLSIPASETSPRSSKIQMCPPDWRLC